MVEARSISAIGGNKWAIGVRFKNIVGNPEISAQVIVDGGSTEPGLLLEKARAEIYKYAKALMVSVGDKGSLRLPEQQ